MKKDEHGNIRVYALCFAVFLFWCLIVQKLFDLQVKNYLYFQVRAASQQGYSSSVQTTRGIIKSSDGVELAINTPSYNVDVYTPNVKDTLNFEDNILPIISVDKALYEDQKSQGLSQFQIAKGITPEKKSEIEKKLSYKNAGSIIFELDEKRVYPNNYLLSHALGFVDTSGNGQYGLEGFFNGDLKGLAGDILGNKDQYGNPIVNSNLSFIAPTLGENITLTINAYLQRIVEDKLKTWVDNEQADGGSVVIIDPKTGAIQAMANYPTYDPNNYYKGYILDCNSYIFKDQDACKDPTKTLDQSILQNSFNNSSIQFVYEPGSVIKAVTASAAIEDKKITLDTQFNDSSGYFQADDKRVYNFNKKPDGKMNMQEILKKSSNVGASMVASLVGKDELYKFYNEFGIGNPTGITLQGEQTGNIPKSSTWKDIDLATASFGQFVGATPLQVTGIYQTLANQGVRMKPYIVKSIEKNGITTDTKPEILGKVVSAETAKQVTQMLQYTTTGEPAWGLRFLQSYIPEIASKTGTAQVPLPDQSGYDPNLINATYVGYAPVNNPKFVMLVLLKSPRTGEYAFSTAVPLWADIAKDLFLYYKIPPQ